MGAGTLFGLAIGDALGAAVEFMSLDQIRTAYGPDGITDLDAWRGFPAGSYTDDTQMSLATAKGLIAAAEGRADDPLPFVRQAYLDWLQTQDDPQHQRAPGMTCLSALRAGGRGSSTNRINNSKGCGGVMRTAPVGLIYPAGRAFTIGVECAAITHSHPSGFLSAGLLSALIARLIRGDPLAEAIADTRPQLTEWDGHEETLHAVDEAVQLGHADLPAHQAIVGLGEGWVGEEALAIALYCALKHPTNFRAAVVTAVNHSGDSDSTGSICGAIVGASLGVGAIPVAWHERVENREELVRIADVLGQVT